MRLANVAILALLLVACSCCGTDEKPDIAPSTELQQVVDRGAFAWLNMRMCEEAWVIFNDPSAGWRTKSTIEGFSEYFTEIGVEICDPPELWMFLELVQDIQQDSIYLAENPPLDVFIQQIQHGLGFAEKQLTLDFGE